MATALLVIQILGMIAELYPKLSPMIADLMNAIKGIFSGTPTPDITQAEFETRIDAAIAALPEWK